MMQRMKVYSGLLTQDLGAQHKRELFDLLPVVVYSGHRKYAVFQASGQQFMGSTRRNEMDASHLIARDKGSARGK
jgi:hypothetical protein